MASGSSFGAQLKAILIRNFLLKLRGRRHTIVEMVMPLYFILILIIIRLGIPVTNLPPLTTPQTAFRVDDLTALTNLTVGFVGGPGERTIEQELRTELSSVAAVLLDFDSEQELLDYMDLNNSSVVSFAVVFGNWSDGVSYTLRPMPEMNLPELDTLYATEDKCHPTWSDDPSQFKINEMAVSCPAREYYDVGFVQLQSLVDTAIIRNSTITRQSQLAASVNVSVVVFPKAAFKGNTEYLRSFVPLYMAIAFTPFVAYLCILIVGEKERKIKDAMKLMGLKSPVYWLGWLITYGVLVVILSLVTTILLVVAKITPKANMFLLFILITLYGFSTITVAFLVTPFFNSAKAAGGFASLSSSLFSCLYYVAVYAKGVPTSVYYALSLLSPTAFALGMDKVVYLDLVEDGIDFDNFWQDGYCFGSSVIMLAVDVVLYGVLAYYFDNVIPGEYGVKRPPWFFLMPSFWCPKPRRNKLLDAAESVADEENINFEKVSADFIGKEALRIFNISKVFNGCGRPQMVAVDGISLDLYEGQITAILGHNGAGKTTLLNMLVGLTQATGGTATVYGLDISDPNNFEAIWNQIGICLQQDVLFDELTPTHHLEFFGRIKGVPEKKLKEKVKDILDDVDLTDRKDTPAGKISGGQKRKLSIGIALIGDPKIVILDEPTSGVDPYSRRHLWNLLQNNKKDRLIILTTHFMDEADILADRKAIVSHGKVKCVGSSLFLKNKFGLGYHLTMVVENHFDEKAIKGLIREHIDDSKKVRSNASELAYRLPFEQVGRFPDLLAALDQAVLKQGPNADVGLKSYGISMTTLEEVFLKLGEDDAENARTSLSVTNGVLHRPLSSEGEEFAAARVLDGVQIEYSWLQAFLYMMKMNMVAVLRLPRQIISTVVVPIILIIVTFYLMTLQTTDDDVGLTAQLGLNMYPNYSVLYTNDTGGDNLDPFLLQLDKLGVSYFDFPDNFSALLEVPPHTFYLNITAFDATLLRLSVEAAYNDTAQHSLPVLMNMLSNALMGIVSDDRSQPQVKIAVASEPLPRHTVPVTFSGSTMGAVLMIGFAYTMMTAVYSADAVEDRETKVKHQLQVSGLPFTVYWFSKFCGNFVLFAIALVATVVIIEAFQVDPFKDGAALGILVLGYVLYMISGLFFGYCLSFAFKKYETAQSFLPICFMILGFAPYMAVCLTDMLIADNGYTAKVMHYIFTILLPIYSPYSIIYYLDKVYTTSLWTGDEPSGTDYFTEEVIVTLVALPIQALALVGLLWVLDFRSSNGQWSEILDACRPKRPEPTGYDPLRDNDDVPDDEDEDVREERRRVQHLDEATAANRTSVVVMQGLRKEFSTKKTSPLYDCLKKKKKKKKNAGLKVAVRNLTFAVEKAEVFGLLGPNGAGKTTALRTIVADEIPSKGKVTVAGYNMATDLKKAIRNIGYCPQHDALWKTVTVREHLECYANIRGVKRSMIAKVTQALMDGLQIAEHADKRTEHLSGGTKRKLSYAISMLGDPKIVLLDEPSTGMDPQSKRYLWDTIMANFQGERGAILTTHSMEEADFLCSRVGIMVKGQLMCIGSTQHLKNRYGSGYTLEAKLVAGEQRNRMLDNLDKDIKRIFQGATVQERFEDRVKYQIPQTGDTTLAEIFTKLEEVKTRYNVEEYSFSQTTLEQVFLEFAKQQEFETREEGKEGKSTDV